MVVVCREGSTASVEREGRLDGESGRGREEEEERRERETERDLPLWSTRLRERWQTSPARMTTCTKEREKAFGGEMARRQVE